jgi:hypothetical protein
MENSIDEEICLHFPEVASINGISGIAGRSQNFAMFLARTEFKKKVADVKLLKKMNDIAHIQLQATERNFDELKDSVDAKEKMAAKKQKIMAKLNVTNQMLIQTLNTLELNTDIVDGFLSSQITSSNEDSNIILSKNNDTYLQNLKLKESLLNLTRDHYRAADGIRHMGTGIEELRHSLQGYSCNIPTACYFAVTFILQRSSLRFYAPTFFPSHVLPQIKDAEKKKELLIELAQLRNEDVVDMIKAMKRESSGGYSAII